MSITLKLRKWVEDNRTRLYMGGLDPYEVGTIADEIDAEHKRLSDKAHADGERSAMKQVRSRSEDYKKGYEQAMKDVDERTKTEQSGSQTIDILMELLNEYRESGCALDEDRVTYYADRLDGRTEVERTKTEQNGVGITDELRECIATAVWQYENDVKTAYIPKDKLLAIADRIDERYEQSKRNLTDALHQQEEATFKLSEKSVLLPVDADGVPIRVGDEIEVFNGNHDRVRLLALRESGWSVNYLEWNPASLRHRKPDSWERIIDDALHAFLDDDSPAAPTKEELVERCKKLAGEGE